MKISTNLQWWDVADGEFCPGGNLHFGLHKNLIFPFFLAAIDTIIVIIVLVFNVWKDKSPSPSPSPEEQESCLEKLNGHSWERKSETWTRRLERLPEMKDFNVVSSYEFVDLDHLAASIGAGERVDPEESNCPVNIFVGEIRIRGLQQRVHGLPAQKEHQQTF